MDLQSPLSSINGIGPSIAKKLEKVGLYTLNDLIYHFPFRYEDYSKQVKLSEAKVGEEITVKGDIWSIETSYSKFGKLLTKAVLNDGSNSVELLWFNQSWLKKSILTGDTLQIAGKVTRQGAKLQIVSPKWEKIVKDGQGIHTGRLVPIYPETSGLTSKWIRQKINSLLPVALALIQDPLPEEIRENKLRLADALYKIHLPKDYQDVYSAKKRLGFDELFEINLNTQKIRHDWKTGRKAPPLRIEEKDLQEFLQALPFTLTNGQKKVLDEILDDIQKNQAMNRLVQGEVGSGKTVIAAAALFLTVKNKLKGLFMAPTEILALQHFKSLDQTLTPLGVKIGLYTGSKKFTTDKGFNPDIIIGTHALLSEKLIKEKVGLIVVDEQQRFGVEQRSLLRHAQTESGDLPHFLTMTATPIPRTVALTLFGDLDISFIGELPKGRKQIKTFVVPSYKRQDAYRFIQKKVLEGDQVYIITPLIEESETLVTTKAAKVEFEGLKTQVFPKLRLGLLHGRLKASEKQDVLTGFKNKKTDILVSTSVVEVGVDVPNATIMVIEGADRFGLAQLHQFRGRVGRGEKESFCLLFPENEDSQTVQRLKCLEQTTDGMKLAEADLKIRGSGEVFGTRQSGRFDLKIATLSDVSAIEEAREAVRKMLSSNPNLDKHPYYKGKLASLSGIMPD